MRSHASLRRRVFTAATLGMGLGAMGLAYKAKTDEGFSRSMIFWKEAYPAFLWYRWVQWRTANSTPEERAKAFNTLHDYYAPRMEVLVLQMRGFYLKHCQLMSTADFFLPPQYLSFCKRMQSEVPTEFKPGEVQHVIERNLGKPVSEVFSRFDEVPVGSASIGQVHYAILRDTGQEVAVKVQGPGVEARFRSDMVTCISFCQLAMPQHVGPMREIQQQFATEFDYRGEAQNMLEIHDNIMPVYGDKVVIPKPVLELCTKEVLVQDFIPGPGLVKGIRENYGAYARSIGKTLEELEKEEIAKLYKDGKLVYRDINQQVKITRFYQQFTRMKVMLINTSRACWNWSVALVFPSLRKEYARPLQLLNLGEIVTVLNDVHGHEIFIDGCFNGDPHPGNILLVPDGRLGLIDYGQVKRISLGVRILMAKFIIAVSQQDQEAAIQALMDLGNRSKYGNKEVGWRLASFWFDRNDEEIMMGKNIQEFLDWCHARDPPTASCDDMVMIGRVSIMMRGLGNAFGLDLRTARLWEPTARALLDSQNISFIAQPSRVFEHSS